MTCVGWAAHTGSNKTKRFLLKRFWFRRVFYLVCSRPHQLYFVLDCYSYISCSNPFYHLQVLHILVWFTLNKKANFLNLNLKGTFTMRDYLILKFLNFNCFDVSGWWKISAGLFKLWSSGSVKGYRAGSEANPWALSSGAQIWTTPAGDCQSWAETSYTQLSIRHLSAKVSA